MDTYLVHSLQHLSCTKIVTSLLNKNLKAIHTSLLYKHSRSCNSMHADSTHFIVYDAKPADDTKYKKIKNKISKDIENLIASHPLRKKLDNFVLPLFCLIENWIATCYDTLSADVDTCYFIVDNIPQCWLTDGTIDEEKAAKLVVKNIDLLPRTRFIFACNYCLYEDVLNLWELLPVAEKDLLRKHKLKVDCLDPWITWLESKSNKDWQFCVAWILGTPLWDMNMYVLRRVLGALTPSEISHYLKKALIGKEVTDDVMRFCLSIVTRDEQELIFKESPIEVLKCISSWPLRNVFFDIADNFWPYLTKGTFCAVINKLLIRVKNQRREYLEILVILKNFWMKSPRDFQDIRYNGLYVEALKFVLEYDFREEFQRKRFIATLKIAMIRFRLLQLPI